LLGGGKRMMLEVKLFANEKRPVTCEKGNIPTSEKRRL